MVWILFIVILGKYHQRVHLHSLRIRILLLIIASLIALFVTPDLRAGLGVWKAYIIDPILFFVTLLALFEKKDVRLIINTLGFSALLISFVSIVQYATGFGIPAPWQAWPDRRATAFYPFPNAVGLYIAPIIGLFIGKYFFDKRSLRIFSSLLIFFGIVTIFTSRSDGALIGVFVALLLALWFSGRKKFTLFSSSILLALAFLIPQTRAILTFQDVSGQVRLALWQGTWNMLWHHPLAGAGLSGFPTLYDQYRLARHTELLRYPHNIFLNFWSELGILGLVWFFSLFPLVWRNFSKTKDLSMPIFISFTALFVYGLVDVPYFKNDLAILFWVLLALSCLEQKDQRAS